MKNERLFSALGLVLAVPALLSGCSHTVKVEPIQVEPIHMTLDINVKVDRELDRFFDFEKRYDENDAAPREAVDAGDNP